MNIYNYSTYIPQFRGRLINDSNQWKFGYLYSKGEIDGKAVIIGMNWPIGAEWEVDPDTISIFTGFKDANDTMIYDGDIIEFGTQKRQYLVYWNDEAMWWDTELISGNALQRSEWRCSEYRRLGWLRTELPILGECSTKVIGNRWDNPELLPPAPKWDSNPWGDDF